MFVTDPASDQQSLKAVNTGLPIVGLVDANNKLRNVDVALANNKVGLSLSLIYWLLCEVLKLRGETTDDAWAEANDLEIGSQPSEIGFKKLEIASAASFTRRAVHERSILTPTGLLRMQLRGVAWSVWQACCSQRV